MASRGRSSGLTTLVAVGADARSDGPIGAAFGPASPIADVLLELTGTVGSGDLAGAMELTAAMAGCPAALLRPDRSLLAASGGYPNRSRALRWVSGGGEASRELVISSGTRRVGVLVFRRPVCGLEQPVWQAVHDLLSLALSSRQAVARAEHAEQLAALLDCFCDDVVGAGPVSCPEARARPVRHRPAVLTPVGSSGSSSGPGLPVPLGHARRQLSAEPLLAAGQLAALGERAVYLYATGGADGAGPGPRAHAEAWRRLADAPGTPRWRVVVGLPALPGAALRDSYRTASWLADLQATPLPGLPVDDVALVDELGVVAGTLGPSWGSRLRHFIGRVLGDVVDNPRFGGEILDTLHAYLVSGSSPTEAARILHLSPSSMKYRMRIIREALGDRLDDHDSAFEIELALRLLKSFQALGRPMGESRCYS